MEGTKVREDEKAPETAQERTEEKSPASAPAQRGTVFNPQNQKRPERTYIKNGIHKMRIEKVSLKFNPETKRSSVVIGLILEGNDNDMDGKKLVSFFQTEGNGGDYFLEFLQDCGTEIDLSNQFAIEPDDNRLIGLAFKANIYNKVYEGRNRANLGAIVK